MTGCVLARGADTTGIKRRLQSPFASGMLFTCSVQVRWLDFGFSDALSYTMEPQDTTMAKSKKLTPRQLEDLYDSGDNRVTQERSDFFLPQVVDFVKQKKWMNIRPEYQRRLVWDRKKKSLFIESLLMNIPVPPIFLYESDLSRYEVMDGQQRVNAIIEFYENELKLVGLETWPALNGYTYKKCPPRIQKGLDRRRISATVLLAENNRGKHGDIIRRAVFERLNTGGMTLNQQELRNSLYSGSFNDLIVELAGDRRFNLIWGIPPYQDHYRPEENYISQELAGNEYFKRMRDCEIVLRFFALRERKIKGAMRTILDNYMESHQDAGADEITENRASFLECLKIAQQIFGDKTFKIAQGHEWHLSVPLYDGVMVAVYHLRSRKADLIKKKDSILVAMQAAFADESTYEIIVGKPNTAQAVIERLNRIQVIMEKSI